MGDRGGGVGIVDKLRGLGPQGEGAGGGAIPRPPSNLMAGGVAPQPPPQQGFIREMLMNKGAGGGGMIKGMPSNGATSPEAMQALKSIGSFSNPAAAQASLPGVEQAIAGGAAAPVNTLLPTVTNNAANNYGETDPYEIWKAGGRKGQRPPGT